MVIEIISRGLLVKGSQILLAHKIGENNTFLPGGHLEEREYSVDALKRELKEELGLNVFVEDFVGVLEHKFFDDKGKFFEEINLIFNVKVHGSSIKSDESHLEFFWANIDELEKEILYPSSLPELIRKWLATRIPFHSIQC